MTAKAINLESSWKNLLQDEFSKTYFTEMAAFLRAEKQNGKVIYPPGALIFQAFKQTPLSKLKIVILGQDPYHNPGEAMGLSFSVPKGIKTPPSLKNIYKELKSDIGKTIPSHGDLSHWADQGILLLNAMLTVEKNRPGSHKKIGWQKFTDAVIMQISETQENIIFMLWGRFAQSKKALINTKKHYVLEAAHPSPLARGAYFGSKHFSKANHILSQLQKAPIQW